MVSCRWPLEARKRPGVDGPPALEVGHAAAGLLDEDDRRRGVPGLEPDLDHRLGRALGDQRVAPEVAEAALAPDVVEQGLEARARARTARCRGREP